MTDLLLGIDVGTTSTKAALFDLADPRQPRALSRRASQTYHPHSGWSEADQLAVRDCVAECVRELVGKADATTIRTIGISGTACGAWLVANGTPVRPAILWNDGRAASIVSGWQNDGRMNEIFAVSGNVPFPGYTLPVLRWLIMHEPERVAAATHLLCCKDWVRGWLTGVWGTEESDASYVPFDIRARDWSERLSELTETTSFRHLLPPLLPVSRVDPLLDSVARELGLPEGIPVSLGATDIVAGCIGGGAVAAGRAVTILGTSANSSIVTDAPVFEPPGIGIMAAAPLDRWVRTMVNTSGTMTLDWAARLFSGGSVGELFRLAAESRTDDVPLLLPYLAGAGVVSPFVDAHARGVFAGLRADHGPAEMCRAAVDGLAFAVADCYADIPGGVTRVTATGGAARSDLLLQTIADATGAEILRPAGEEFGARGAALLAAFRSGLVTAQAFASLAEDIDVDRIFLPERQRVGERLARYRAVGAATRETGRLWP